MMGPYSKSEELVIRCEWMISERPDVINLEDVWTSDLQPFHAENSFRFGLKPSTSTVFFINVFPRNSGFHISHVYLVATGLGVAGDEMTSRTDITESTAQMFTHHIEGYTINDLLTTYNFYIHIVQTFDEYAYQPIDTTMSKQMWSLVTDNLMTDTEFVVGDRTFNAHQAILSARSPVFAAMFKTDMKESRTKRVDIEDMDARTFEEFLFFLYTGQLRRTAADLGLLRAADKYQVDALKSLCTAATAKDLLDANFLSGLLMKIA